MARISPQRRRETWGCASELNYSPLRTSAGFVLRLCGKSLIYQSALVRMLTVAMYNFGEVGEGVNCALRAFVSSTVIRCSADEVLAVCVGG
jgi:hypothetical protein